MPKELYHKSRRFPEENLFSVMSVRAILENSENTLATIESELVEGKDLEALYDSIKCVQNDLNSALTKLIGATVQGLEESDTEEEEETTNAENGDDNERSKKKIKTS